MWGDEPTDPHKAMLQSPPATMPPATGPALSAGQMSLVLDVTRMLAVTADLDLLLRRIAEAVTALLDCERASIFLHDADRGELWTKVALGREEIRMPLGAGIVGHVFASNRPIHVPRPYDDPRFNRVPDQRTGFTTRNLLAVPMVDINQTPVGVIQALNKTAGNGAAFTENDQAMLQLLADQGGVAVQRYRLQQAAMESVALRKEMELARGVQEAMIPRSKPDVRGLEAAGWTHPASINGGDVFDLWKTPDGRLGVLLADASGHGMAPALVACQVRTLVRSLCEAEGGAADPFRLLSLVNTRLCDDLPMGRFVTVFLGFIGGDGVMSWCSGGHSPVITRDARGRGAEIHEATLPPLGIIAALPDSPPPPVQLGDDAWLMVASDGITEAFNPQGELFGESRLVGALDAHATRADDAIESLKSAVWQWQGKQEPVDDQTVVVVVRK
jgi:sigma-B regulation protein RsbU (phosphoserine phosphatase)